LVSRGANIEIKRNDIPFGEFKNIDCLYITALSGEVSNLLYPIVQAAHTQNLLVAVNPGMSQLKKGAINLRRSLKYIDILLLNSDEMKQLVETLGHEGHFEGIVSDFRKNCFPDKFPLLLKTNIATVRGEVVSLKDAFSVLLDLGPKMIVVTDGRGGSYVGTENDIYYHPIIPGKRINALGAGDAFCSTFVSQIVKDESIEDAIRSGIINSTAVVGFEDAKSGLLTEEQMNKKMSLLDKTLFTKYPMNI